MSQRRSIAGDSQRAYRVVRDGYGVVRYYGPYSTLSAAKGMLTRESRYANRHGDGAVTFHIEQTPEGWERVE